MNSPQTLKRILLLSVAGLSAVTAGRAAGGDVLVNNQSSIGIPLTGTIQTQQVSVTMTVGTATSFDIGAPVYTNGPLGLPNWLSATAPGCDNNNQNCSTPNTLSLSLTNDLGHYTGPFTATVTLSPHGGGGASATISVTFYPGVVGIPGALIAQTSKSNPVSVLPIAYSSGQTVTPTQQVQVTGTTSYVASAGTLSGGPWLVINAGASSGTQIPSTPSSQILNITLNPANLANLPPALYEGFVVITGADGTSTATINVNLSLNGGTVGAVAASPSQLTFSWSLNTSPFSVPTQQILVSAPAGSLFTATTDHPDWIILPAQATGMVPGNLPVFVNPIEFTAPTTQSGHVTITVGSVTQTINVQLNVSTTPVLWARTGSTGGTVMFTSQGSISTPVSQKVTLVASDGSSPALTITSSPTWATVSLSGNTLTITPNVSGTAPTILSDQVVITAPNMANSPLAIPVLMVENGGSASGPLTLNPSSLSFTALQGGAKPDAQHITVSAPVTTGFNIAATTNNGIAWFTVEPSFGGATNTTLSVSVDPTLVAASPNPYAGAILLTVSNTGQTQTIPVTLTVNAAGIGNITTDVSSLNLTAQVGTATQSATITVSNPTPGTAPVLYNVTTSASAPWLSATPSQAATQSAVIVTASPSGLTPNTYQGQVTISPLGGTPVIVNVSFTVQAAPVISASRTSYTFTYQTGGDAPAPQTVQITGGAFTATVSSGNDWLSVTPGSGPNPTSFTISVNPSGQSSGSHVGVISVAGADNTILITVTLNVMLPLPTITNVVNGASFLTGSIAGGEVITVFGTELGPETALTAQFTSSGSLATTLQGVQLFVDGFAAPLIFANNTQITAVVPYEIASFQQAMVQVVYLNQRSNVVSLPVTNSSPAIFTLNSAGTGMGAHNADFSPNGPTNPVTKGSYVVFFMTGEGPLDPAGVTGRVNPSTGGGVAIAALPIGVLIDNQPANWNYAGGIPGVVEGIMQLNVQIPSNARSGNLPVLVNIGGNGSQSGVTVSVK